MVIAEVGPLMCQWNSFSFSHRIAIHLRELRSSRRLCLTAARDRSVRVASGASAFLFELQSFFRIRFVHGIATPGGLLILM